MFSVQRLMFLSSKNKIRLELHHEWVPGTRMRNKIEIIKKEITKIEEEELNISLDCYGHDGEGFEEMTESEQSYIEEWDTTTQKKLDKIIKILS